MSLGSEVHGDRIAGTKHGGVLLRAGITLLSAGAFEGHRGRGGQDHLAAATRPPPPNSPRCARRRTPRARPGWNRPGQNWRRRAGSRRKLRTQFSTELERAREQVTIAQKRTEASVRRALRELG